MTRCALIVLVLATATAAADTKKFPSGHSVDLPPGTWKLSGSKTVDTARLTDHGRTIIITVRAFTKGDCDKQRKLVPAKAADVTADQNEQVASWFVSYPKGKRQLNTMCVATDYRSNQPGGFIGTIDYPPAPKDNAEAMAALLTGDPDQAPPERIALDNMIAAQPGAPARIHALDAHAGDMSKRIH